MIRVYENEQFYEFEFTDSFQLFANNYFYLQTAGGIVYNSDNEILMIKKYNKWDCPKGKIEVNETPEMTAIREVTEETGVKDLKIIGTLPKTYHIYPLKSQKVLKEVTWFAMKSDKISKLIPQIEENIQDIKWVAQYELELYLKESYPSLRQLFVQILRS